jgi:hypothetical protein
MPVIPSARQQTNIPGFVKPDQAGLSLVLSEANRLSGKLSDTSKILASLKQERDVATATDAVYQFNNAAREKYVELKSLRGGNAVDLEKKYNEWYDRASQDFGKTLLGPTQQNIYRQRTRGRREADLRSLQTHEIAEHQRFMESSAAAVFSGRKKDVVAYSSDPERVETAIEEANGWVDVANPGMDNSEAKQAQADELMATAIVTEVRRDPANAKALLERWRTRLGDKSRELEIDVDTEFLYFSATTEHNDYDAQYDFIKNMRGVSEPIKRKVMARINSDEAEADHREAESLRKRQQRIKENSLQAWVDYSEGSMTSARLHDLARDQQIDATTFNAIRNDMKDPTIANDPYVVGALAEAQELGRDISIDLDQAMAAGNIKKETYIAMRTAAAKKGFDRAFKFVVNATKLPSDFYNPDKQLLYAEGLERFNLRVAAGEPPLLVAREVVESWTDDVSRTIIGLPRPRFMPAGMEKGDLAALDQAEQRTIENRGRFSTVSEYRMEMDNINALRQLAEAYSKSTKSNPELEKRLKEMDKLNN